MTLKDKRLVVLGGTSGLGFATAAAAAREGAHLVVASAKEELVSQALVRLPAGTEGHVADFTHEDQVRDLFGRIGAFDHLVYTAGDALLLSDFAETSIADARRAFEVRVWGAMTAVKYGAPHIRAGGSIVLTTGIASQRPAKGWVVPSSLLGTMEAMTRALAVELAPIRVNIVSPGVVKTEMWNQLSEETREGLYRDVGAKLLVGRVGEASEVAETFLYLMRQTYSTGQVVTVDGGGVLV
ncbi:MAG TPA: SDR family oxidoreductase [Aliidongia sp.]|nr:SDR family oxidoreductase [Aliidongia sp.]